MTSKSRKKETQEFQYISQNREKEVYQVFKTIGIPTHLQDQPYLSQSDHVDVDTPFKKFSMLEDGGYTFETKSSS